jgi:hypothetical protein
MTGDPRSATTPCAAAGFPPAGAWPRSAVALPPPDAAERAWRGRMALLCLGLLAAAMLFGDGGPVASHHLPVPRVCLMQALVHRPCPACGLTRSVAHALRFDLRASAAAHPAGPWLTLALGAGFIWFGVAALTGVRSAALWRAEVRFLTWTDYTLAVVLLAIWVHRLILNAG